MKQIILASSSPRRIEMMKQNKHNPLIIPAKVNEDITLDISCEASVMYLALKKASYVYNKIYACHSESNSVRDCENKTENFLRKLDPSNLIIIAADTIVMYDKKIIGKPVNEVDAFNTLSALNGKKHHVITGVSIIDTERKIKRCFYDDTKVFFKQYSEDDLREYIKTAEPYDKAGGYAIQGTFSKYIDHIEGDYDNVVGFPWYRIAPYLR